MRAPIGLTAALLLAVGCHAPSAVPGRTELEPEATVTRLVQVAPDVIVEAWLNGRGPFRFQIDTGSAANLVAPRVVQALDLEMSASYFGIRGIQGTEYAPRARVAVDLVEIGRARFHDVGAIVHPMDGVDGLLGFPFFSDTRLRIDAPRRSLTLARPGGTLEDGIAYTTGDGTPWIELELGPRSGVFKVDTGNRDLVLVESLEHLTWLTTPRSILLHGINGASLVVGGRVAEPLRIGAFEVERPIVWKADRNNIGMSILQHFALTFDPELEQVVFERADRSPIEVPPMRGYAIERDAEGVVHSVVPDTRAAASGIRVGDRIVSTVISMSARERHPDLRVKVERDGEPELLDFRVPYETVVP